MTWRRTVTMLALTWVVTLLGLAAWVLLPAVIGLRPVVVGEPVATGALTSGDVLVLPAAADPDRPVPALVDDARVVVPRIGLPVLWWRHADLVPLGVLVLTTAVAVTVLFVAVRGPLPAPARAPSPNTACAPVRRRRQAAAPFAAVAVVAAALALVSPLGTALATPFSDTVTNGTNAVAADAWTNYLSTITGDSPSSYWRLGDAAGGSTAAAQVGGITGTWDAQSHGTVSGPIVNNVNLAADINGNVSTNQQCLRFGDQYDFTNLSSFSLELWFQVRAFTNGNYPRLISKMGTGGGYEVAINAPDGGNPNQVYFARTDSGGTATYTGSGSAISLNTWYHMVATFNATTKVMTFYLNGTPRASNGGSTGNLGNTTNPLVVGCLGNSSSYFNGLLDEVAIYSTALTDRQVRAHYRAGLAGY